MESYKINGYLVLPEKYEQSIGFSISGFDYNMQKVLFDNVVDAQEIVKKI